MQECKPLVSIIIPVYNGANYMREAIDSALAQTYQNIEVIVVNDGSTDDGETERLALSYGDKIRYFHKENGGVSTALNFGIKNMRGDYFSWLSHDDKYTEEKVEKQIEALSRYANPDLVALCADRQINKKSEFIGGEKIIKDFSEYTVTDSKDALHWILKHGYFSGCSFLLPKSVFEKCGMFDEALRYSQDFLMWVKIFLAGYGLVYTKHIGVYNRVHENQVTQTRRDLFRHDSKKIAEEIVSTLVGEDEQTKKFVYAHAKRNAILGNVEVVKICKNAVKETGGFSFGQSFSLGMATLYGKVRPCIRKIYYSFFKKVKI